MDSIHMIIESGVLNIECACSKRARRTCGDCAGTGYRFHQLRLECTKFHWAGNWPAECHPLGFALPSVDQLSGILTGMAEFRNLHRLPSGGYTASFRPKVNPPVEIGNFYCARDGRTAEEALVAALIASVMRKSK